MTPPVTSSIQCGPTKPDLFFPCSHDQTSSPDLAAQESFSKAEGGKSKFLPEEKSRQEEQNAILKNLFTVSEGAASALQSKNTNSECKNGKDADSGLEESIKTTDAEEASSFLKSPDIFNSIVDEKVDGRF